MTLVGDLVVRTGGVVGGMCVRECRVLVLARGLACVCHLALVLAIELVAGVPVQLVGEWFVVVVRSSVGVVGAVGVVVGISALLRDVRLGVVGPGVEVSQMVVLWAIRVVCCVMLIRTVLMMRCVMVMVGA